MYFKNRSEAATQLAGRLAAYKGQNPLVLPEAGVPDLLKLGMELWLHRVEHDTLPRYALSPQGTSTTLPAFPDRSRAIAASNSCMGMTWVMAGRTSSRPEPSRLSI